MIDRLLIGEWQDDALCRESDPELWFPESKFDEIAARETCSDCPVRGSCLAAGIDDPHGIWGGWSAPERQRLRKRLENLDREARDLVMKHAAEAGPRHYKMND